MSFLPFIVSTENTQQVLTNNSNQNTNQNDSLVLVLPKVEDKPYTSTYRPINTAPSKLFGIGQNDSTFKYEVCEIINKAEKTYYNGGVKNGKRHGEGTFIDKSAHVEYKGQWMDDNIKLNNINTQS